MMALILGCAARTPATLVHVHVEGRGLDIHEDRDRADAVDGAGGGEEGVGRGEDLIAGADVQTEQRQEKGVGAGSASHGELRAGVSGDFLLELLDVLAHDEFLGIDDAGHLRQHFVADLAMLGAEVQQRDLSLLFECFHNGSG